MLLHVHSIGTSFALEGKEHENMHPSLYSIDYFYQLYTILYNKDNHHIFIHTSMATIIMYFQLKASGSSLQPFVFHMSYHTSLFSVHMNSFLFYFIPDGEK
jgi:hypothetical protein